MNELKVIMIVLIFSFIAIVSAQSTEKIFVLYMTVYSNDSVELIEFKEDVGIPTVFADVGSKDYVIKIISLDGEVLYRESFTISFVAMPYPIDPEVHTTTLTLEKNDLYLRLPHFNNADKIQLSHDDKIIFEYAIKPVIKPPLERGVSVFLIIIGLIVAVVVVSAWFIYRRMR